MTKTISVALEDHFVGFVDRQLSEGHYASVTEVVQAGLHLLEEYERKVASLRALLMEGERSGPSEPFDFDRFLAGKHGRNPG